ncbi:DUF2214 family protein [Paraglaciecola aquimarina]|uniref:DUF2214 family protein n=1 Tax=Paraglaciecola aquimarina TaxID=1235557 RepID=A0ABU3SZC0_9ALTE|nr:DUF2214 family protein [Paraglaciecola aquimarina]MDU0355361.1 DUF2214 family protein [Paraglaciecola aquimarina]
MIEAIVRYFHFLGIIILAGTLVSKHMLLVGQVNVQQMQKLAKIDRVYGTSALIVFLAGLTLWFMVGKPKAFYSANGLFHLKVTLFFVMSILSIYPTIFIVKANRAKQAVTNIPKRVVNTVRAELLCLILIPLTAVFMAKGYGL